MRREEENGVVVRHTVSPVVGFCLCVENWGEEGGVKEEGRTGKIEVPESCG